MFGVTVALSGIGVSLGNATRRQPETRARDAIGAASIRARRYAPDRGSQEPDNRQATGAMANVHPPFIRVVPDSPSWLMLEAARARLLAEDRRRERRRAIPARPIATKEK